MRELRALLGSEEACARWIKSVRGTVTTKSFTALLRATGGFEEAIAWLRDAKIESPALGDKLVRIHIGIPNPKSSGKLKRTTISLDVALHGALITKLGSPGEANAWLGRMAKDIAGRATGGVGLSRALQGEAIKFVAAPPADAA